MRPSSTIRAEDAELLASIADDYYLKGFTQDRIASTYLISRSYVSRLVRRARDLGIVEIHIKHPVARLQRLETAVRQRFALREAVVVACPPGDDANSLVPAGQEGARLIAELVRPGETIAVAYGTGVRSVLDALRPNIVRAGHVVPLFGGSLVPTEINTTTLVVTAGRLLGASYDLLHAPWIVETPQLARALREQPEVAAVLARAAAADIAVVGIGAIGSGSSALLFNNAYLNEAELSELAVQGAVGDIAARIYDRAGRPCQLSFNARIIGPDLPMVRRIPTIVGVAVGRQKGPSILAALRGGLLDVLVTDGDAAEAVLEHAS